MESNYSNVIGQQGLTTAGAFEGYRRDMVASVRVTGKLAKRALRDVGVKGTSSMRAEEAIALAESAYPEAIAAAREAAVRWWRWPVSRMAGVGYGALSMLELQAGVTPILDGSKRGEYGSGDDARRVLEAAEALAAGSCVVSVRVNAPSEDEASRLVAALVDAVPCSDPDVVEEAWGGGVSMYLDAVVPRGSGMAATPLPLVPGRGRGASARLTFDDRADAEPAIRPLALAPGLTGARMFTNDDRRSSLYLYFDRG